MLTPRRKRLGIAVARKSNFAAAGECLKIPQLRQYIIKKIGKLVRLELCQLCSDKTASILRQHSAENFKDFSWNTITNELLTNAPILMSILTECIKTKTPRVNSEAVIATCVGLLVKNRFKKMCFIQKIVSLILYAGRANKQVSIQDHLMIPIIAKCMGSCI